MGRVERPTEHADPTRAASVDDVAVSGGLDDGRSSPRWHGGAVYD